MRMMNGKIKNLCIALITLLAIALIIMIGPCDKFAHGYFGEEIDCSQIATEDFYEEVNLADSDYSMTFVPQKSHMAGVEIYLTNQPMGNTGYLKIEITDQEGKKLDTIDVDLANVKTATWYKVCTEADLKKGEEYTLIFSATDSCKSVPHLQRVDSDYLPDEITSGDALVCFAYAKSTFTPQEKVLITLFIVAAWLFAMSLLLRCKKTKFLQCAAGFVFGVSILTWNYMYNSMDNQNTSFPTFQDGSEAFATGELYAEKNGEYFKGDAERGYGLGWYFDIKGSLPRYDLTYITNSDWLNGYSRNEGAVIVNSNPYTKMVAVAGNQILFKNGESYKISSVSDDGANLVIYLNSGKVLSSAKYGSLDDVDFLDANGKILFKSRVMAYPSQYGLQGKAFRHIARYVGDADNVLSLNLICALATAIVFMIIVALISIKYNKLMAGCFFITFWLSPWVVNFARNLYWVEFTWFIPMAIGLLCSLKINSRKWRIACYVASFVAITGKCLCGYEYITVVMLGLIAFLMVDLFCAIIGKDKEKAKLIFRTTFIIGVVALAGFMMAICIHAQLRGNGNVIEGIKNILEQDVLRRTHGADVNSRNPLNGREGYSIFASTWEVFCLYFHFDTEIITGIAGNLFGLVCLVPLAIFAYEYKRKKLNIQLVFMYAVFFLASISWFVLAKAHSYVHTHMNYVLWYFGYIQICFYIIVNKIVSEFKSLQREQIEE